MFAEKFDALMKVAEVSNSLLGKNVNMNPSHIGRLRSGVRPLAKRHEYLTAMCRYLSGRIRQDYQRDALRQLTGIGSEALSSPQDTALYLEQWLTGSEKGSQRLSSGSTLFTGSGERLSGFLYGNAGKRKAVEQFFTLILQAEKPRTLLLFSDEDMSWLYEDSAFALRWAELFRQVIARGNQVRIIHTVSRDMNEMLEAVRKWLPLYMSGSIEPYYYPRLRDGVFRRTLFLAPDIAAVASSSVGRETDGMLNLFVTDRSALEALTREYEHYFALCRPLLRIFTGSNSLQKALEILPGVEEWPKPKGFDALLEDTRFFMREDAGIILAKATPPELAFLITDQNLLRAFWDYMENRVGGGA